MVFKNMSAQKGPCFKEWKLTVLPVEVNGKRPTVGEINHLIGGG
jgi:hypothetical protein